ncbi:MAG TPA: restriction endonuclease subunit S [Bacteroidetes bacterium]|nr:restriction endonuclease subunit S [Bacteroidota bacterium]
MSRVAVNRSITKQLGELVHVSKGKKHKPSEEGKYRYLNIEDLHNPTNSVFTEEKGNYVSKSDVLIAWDGANAGKVGVGFEGMIGSTLAKLEPISEEIHSPYLFWFLESKNAWIKSQRTGATIPHVNGASLKSLQIPLPPLETQKRIAAMLDAADALRRKDRELLDKYDELAQAIFIDMFGTSKMKAKLADIATKITDGVHAKPNYIDSGVPFLSVKNATKRFLDFNDTKFITQSDHEKFSKRCNPEYEDILYTKVGATYGRAAIVDTKMEFSIYVSLALIKPDRKKVYPYFLNFVLNTDYVKMQADRRVKGAGVPDLHLVEIKDFDIPLPSYAEQLKFSNIVEKLNQIKLTVNNQRMQSNDLFNRLIYNVFNNRISK